jgi:glycosyltransferase involved in cell wall biosynthesis
VNVALVHDYLTQRGGAERVVETMRRAFPDAPVYTSLYHAEGTFDDFRSAEIRTLGLDPLRLLRRRHRLALPLLAPAFDRLVVDADVAVCSSSGWAHGAQVTGRKVVYCHTPARWLYQSERYVGERGSRLPSLALRAFGPHLRRWDVRAARSADRYVANSTAVRDRIRDLYRLEAEILHPPPALTPDGPIDETDAPEPGFFVCVSRLLPYKNVAAVVEAFRRLPEERLVVVGGGPELHRLRAGAPSNVALVGRVGDAELRGLYARSAAVVAASYEDFGLTPLEGASFGKPAAVLRFGGFLDTVVEDETGVFFDAPEPAPIVAAIRRLRAASWSDASIRAHAAGFGLPRFVERLRAIVSEEV